MTWDCLSRSKLELIRFNQPLDVSDELEYVHEANEGFGMPPLHRISERGPLQQGVTDLGSRLDPRVIQLVLVFLSDSWGGQYTRRQQILNYLTTAFDSPVLLKFTLPNGVTVRQLDCYSSDGPIYRSEQIASPTMMKVGFSLVAPNPLWYDPVKQVTVVKSEGGVGGGFVVPVTVPMFFGEDTLDKSVFIDYQGTWSEFPEIEIVGQIENPIITNLDTNEKLDFAGTLIAPGDSYLINLQYGHKTVIDSLGNNKIADLTTDSDLTNFHLQPGFNNLYFEGTNLDTNARFVVRYYSRYLGV